MKFWLSVYFLVLSSMHKTDFQNFDLWALVLNYPTSFVPGSARSCLALSLFRLYWLLAVSPRHACGWNKKSIHEIVAPYITPSIQDFHHSSYRSTYQKSLITKIDLINAMRWTWIEGSSPVVAWQHKIAATLKHCMVVNLKKNIWGPPLKIKILKSGFLHVREDQKIGPEPKFHVRRSSNGKD